MIVTLRGIVIRSIKYGDYDKLITILSQGSGKIFLKASGIRSLSSKNAAGCGMYTYSEFVLDKRADKYYLRKATPLKYLMKYDAPIDRMALSAYFAELCEDTVYDDETSNEVLKLFVNALHVLHKTERQTELVKAVFEIRLLAVLGFMPELSGCISCHKEFENENDYLYFNMLDGHFFCRKCHILNSDNIVQVTPECLAVVKRSISVKENSAYAVALTDKILCEFCAFCECYLISQLEKNYKTLDFYKEVKLL